MASEARRSRAVLVTPIRPGSRLGVQPRLSSAVRSVRRVYTSFSADMPWPRGPEDERRLAACSCYNRCQWIAGAVTKGTRSEHPLGAYHEVEAAALKTCSRRPLVRGPG